MSKSRILKQFISNTHLCEHSHNIGKYSQVYLINCSFQ